MGYSLYLLTATFLAAQDPVIVSAEPDIILLGSQESIKPPPAKTKDDGKVLPKATEDGKAAPSAECCEAGACPTSICGSCCQGGRGGLLSRLFNRGSANCCMDGCSQSCGQRRGFLGLFGRKGCSDCDLCCTDSCSQRLGILSRLRGGSCTSCDICSDTSCDSCCSRSRRLSGLFGKQGCCGAEQMIMDSCCRGGACGTSCSSASCDSCNVCGSERRILRIFSRGKNRCDTCSTCSADSCHQACATCSSGSCGHGMCNSERRILGIFSRSKRRCGGGRFRLARRCRQAVCGVVGIGDDKQKTSEAKAGKDNRHGFLGRFHIQLGSAFRSNGTKAVVARQAPWTVPHTALNMRDTMRSDFENRPQTLASQAARIHTEYGVSSNFAADNGLPGGVVASVDPRPVSRHLEARPALQLVSGMRSTQARTFHDGNYNWITGELQRYDGVWVLRYAASNSADQFGGCVVLFPDVDMSNFRQGDIISVRGNILNSSPSGSRAAHYRVTAAELVER